MQGPDEAEALLYRKGYKAPYWRAPELLRGEPPTKATDAYAYGMLLYEVLYRREPFEKENKEVKPTLSLNKAIGFTSRMHTRCCLHYQATHALHSMHRKGCWQGCSACPASM